MPKKYFNFKNFKVKNKLYTIVILALRRLRQKDSKFKAAWATYSLKERKEKYTVKNVFKDKAH